MTETELTDTERKLCEMATRQDSVPADKRNAFNREYYALWDHAVLALVIAGMSYDLANARLRDMCDAACAKVKS